MQQSPPSNHVDTVAVYSWCGESIRGNLLALTLCLVDARGPSRTPCRRWTARCRRRNFQPLTLVLTYASLATSELVENVCNQHT